MSKNYKGDAKDILDTFERERGREKQINQETH